MKCEIDVRREDDIGYTLGVIAGDGFIGKNTETTRMIMLSVKDKEFCDNFSNSLFNICGRKYKVSRVNNYRYRQGYCWVTRCCIRQVVNFFENYDIYQLSENTDKIKLGFLRGMFDAEGCSFCKLYPKRGGYSRTVAVFNKNKKLLNLCQELLNSFEIKTRKFSKDKDGVYALHLSLSKENLTKFRDLINFSIPRKISNLETCLESYTGG
ncbi:MAG: hypothetical protein KJ697_03030 [Nanoarchaeota archaeon]|nr:hypothetical protein [Nanoarchaeota archaeon]